MAIPEMKVYPRSGDKETIYLQNVITHPNIRTFGYTIRRYGFTIRSFGYSFLYGKGNFYFNVKQVFDRDKGSF